MVMSTLNNRVVIITGGSSGIGKATAARFLKGGAIVYINGRKEHTISSPVRKPEIDTLERQYFLFLQCNRLIPLC